MNPLWLLGLDPADAAIVLAALKRAEQMRHDREKGLANYLAAKTAGLTTKHITRWLRKALTGR